MIAKIIKRKTLFFLWISGFCLNSVYAEETTGTNRISSSSDRNKFTVQFGNPQILKPVKLQYFYHCGEKTLSKNNVPVIPSTKNLRFLKRVDDGRRVAVVQIASTKSLVLNPDWTRDTFNGALSCPTVNYGPIPKLENLSVKQADIFWGDSESLEKSSEISKTSRTYKLLLDSSPADKQIYLLDFLFSENKLQKYRIRTNDKEDTDWILVIKKEEGN